MALGAETVGSLKEICIWILCWTDSKFICSFI